MRRDIFYWKCDCPLDVGRKKALYLADKYAGSGLADVARDIARDYCRSAPAALRPLTVDGNHHAFLFEHDGRPLFLRMDDGLTDDDYLLAESALLEHLARAGFPVPAVHATDATRKRFPVRYQILERIEAPSLNTFFQAGTLDVSAVAKAMGTLLARLHRLPFAGAGFVDTERLAQDGALRGLDADCAEYFGKRLEEHLGYLGEHGLLDADELDRARRLTERAAAVLAPVPPRLVHRDFIYWNLLGGADRIDAVIDWDDAVGGDPADDLGVVNCFLEPDAMAVLLSAYAGEGGGPVDGAFRFRVWLHTFRNMLWKAKLRHQLGYFDRPAGFFLARNDRGLSLADYTRAKLRESLTEAEGRW